MKFDVNWKLLKQSTIDSVRFWECLRSVDEGSSFLGCYFLSLGKILLMFCRSILSLSLWMSSPRRV